MSPQICAPIGDIGLQSSQTDTGMSCLCSLVGKTLHRKAKQGNKTLCCHRHHQNPDTSRITSSVRSNGWGWVPSPPPATNCSCTQPWLYPVTVAQLLLPPLPSGHSPIPEGKGDGGQPEGSTSGGPPTVAWHMRGWQQKEVRAAWPRSCPLLHVLRQLNVPLPTVFKKGKPMS